MRQAAAALLVACRVEWPLERLLHLAARKNTCPAATLGPDIIRLVLEWHFLLNGPEPLPSL